MCKFIKFIKTLIIVVLCGCGKDSNLPKTIISKIDGSDVQAATVILPKALALILVFDVRLHLKNCQDCHHGLHGENTEDKGVNIIYGKINYFRK